MQYRYFFFFQAEDGIRDWSVTGVQTCALRSGLVVLAGDASHEPNVQRVVHDGTPATWCSDVQDIDRFGLGHRPERTQTLDEQTREHVGPQLSHVVVSWIWDRGVRAGSEPSARPRAEMVTRGHRAHWPIRCSATRS